MENIFRHATLDDQTLIKELHPMRYRAGRAHLVSDHQHGEGCKKIIRTNSCSIVTWLYIVLANTGSEPTGGLYN